MPEHVEYCRTRVRSGLDPVAAAAGLARAEFGDFVTYEKPGQVCFGAGAIAELVLDRSGISFRYGAQRSVLPLGAAPLQQVRELLGGLGIEGWRAYGWVAFELCYLLQGRSEAAGPGPLLHLVVPEREVRLSGGTAELRAVLPADLSRLAAELASIGVPMPRTDRAEVDGEVGGAAYRVAVAAAVADIRAGRMQKVILSRVVPVSTELDLVATYEAGRRGNTPARSFLLRLGGLGATGFSPETVAEVSADGLVSTQPLAGTRALSGDPETDRGLRAELLTDPKEVFEHAVSVQTAQAEMNMLCRPGTVHVDGFMGVSERGSVQHLASRVSGRLAEGRNCWHALAGLFPAVTASGLPKVAACDAIREYEDVPRGLYSGAVLVADADGGLDAALVLRTVFQQSGRTWLRAGAGLVDRSTPERELEETREKLRSVSRFLVPATPVPSQAAAAVAAGVASR